ncbi:hypothetical protein Tco_0037735 [Tanacetum coccineum]
MILMNATKILSFVMMMCRREIKCEDMEFGDYLQIRYRNSKIDDTTNERRYDKWFFHNYGRINYHHGCAMGSTSEKVTAQSHQGDYAVTTPGIVNSDQHEDPSLNMNSYFPDYTWEGHNIDKSLKNVVSNEWLKKFSEFGNEIMQLENEYELRIEKKGYILQDILEKCEQVCNGALESWYEEGFEEEEKR